MVSTQNDMRPSERIGNVLLRLAFALPSLPLNRRAMPPRMLEKNPRMLLILQEGSFQMSG